MRETSFEAQLEIEANRLANEIKRHALLNRIELDRIEVYDAFKAGARWARDWVCERLTRYDE